MLADHALKHADNNSKSIGGLLIIAKPVSLKEETSSSGAFESLKSMI